MGYFSKSTSIGKAITDPDYVPTQQKAADYNLGALPSITSLTQKINALNQSEQQKANALRIPGAEGLETQSTANITDALQGKLPADVIAQMQQQAAQRGVATGMPASGNASAAYLRALGLNSLNLQNTGQNWLNQAYARNPSAPLYDAAQNLITGYQQGTLDNDYYRTSSGVWGNYWNALGNGTFSNYTTPGYGTTGMANAGSTNYAGNSSNYIPASSAVSPTMSDVYGYTPTTTPGTYSGYSSTPSTNYNAVAAVGQPGYQPYSGDDLSWLYGN